MIYGLQLLFLLLTLSFSRVTMLFCFTTTSKTLVGHYSSKLPYLGTDRPQGCAEERSVLVGRGAEGVRIVAFLTVIASILLK